VSSQPINLSTSGSAIQITGLASGLDTNSIISKLMSIEQQPLVRLQQHQTGLQALNSQLTSIQSTLQTVALNAQALGSPGLFANTQTVSSSDSTRVSATMGSSIGAGIGGYQVAVTQLANSAQRTFAFTSPAGADTVTIDGQQVSLAAGASVQDLINAINSNPNLDVYAAATQSSGNGSAGTVVLSSRTTGQSAGGSYIQVSDQSGALVENAALAHDGQNALYSINGGAQQSSTTNTVTSAIAGVTLNFNGVTTTSGPVTVNVGAPAPNAAGIEAAVKTFVDSYNSMLDQVNAQLSQKPASGDPTQGALFGDPSLRGLLSSLRQAIYTPGAGISSGPASLADIGVSTGGTTGSATFSANAVSGKLSIDNTALANAIQSKPAGVEQMLQQWSTVFSAIVNSAAEPGGTLDSRITGDNTEISNISDQMVSMKAALADRQATLTAQFAKLEATLSSNQSQANWLTSQINALPTSF
jgi:flagellar hook-associated protein 2